jgi:hypothetical protein
MVPPPAAAPDPDEAAPDGAPAAGLDAEGAGAEVWPWAATPMIVAAARQPSQILIDTALLLEACVLRY